MPMHHFYVWVGKAPLARRPRW